MKKRVAVVILNWNGEKLLEQFLPSVINNTSTEDVEIIVADNCSTDNSIAFLENTYSQIIRIPLDENYGYAEGYNQALKQVEYEYFVLLNSDVEVSPNWLSPMIDFLDTNPDVAGVQPKIRAYRNKDQFEYAGAAGGFIDKYGYPFCRGRIFGTLEKDNNQYEDPIDIFWVSGACFVVRSKDYFETGGLDASFFAHMEEIDLCWRLNARGRRLVCLPQSIVYHVGGATLNEESPRKTFLNFRNNLLMLYKNLPERSLKKMLRARRYLDYLAVIKFAFTGKRKNAQSILKAHKEFRQIKGQYDSARKENLEKVTQTHISTIYPNSILSAYYFKGIKIFSKLNKIKKTF